MDFRLSDDQKALVGAANAFAAELSAKTDYAGDMPRDLWTLWGEQRWLGACIPEALGGMGHDALSTVLTFEAMGRAGVPRGQLFAVGAHLFGCTVGIARHGSDAQRENWCPRLSAGEAVGALAFTDPGGGSNLDACATAIRVEDDELRLDGSKTFVTNGAHADVFVVLAASDDRKPPFNLSVVLVPRDTDGLAIEPLQGVTGLHQTHPARITLTDCRLPADAVLGRVGGGMAVLLDIMRWERSCILAGLLGALERDLVATTGYLESRGSAEKAAAQFQAVSHALARVRVEIESARWLMYRAAAELDGDGGSLIFAAMSKLATSETLVECGLALQRLAAGHGWTGGLGLAEALNDAIGTLSASGTNEAQLNMIYSQLQREL